MGRAMGMIDDGESELREAHGGGKVFRATDAESGAELWESGAEAMWLENEGGLADDDVCAVDALAVGETCWLGGGASPLTIIRRLA